MKILQVHNQYQNPGGERMVVAAEYAMLGQYGHEMRQWVVDNSIIEEAGPIKKAGIALQAIWSPGSYSEVKQRILDFYPDVVHVHNTNPLLSPSVYAACHSAGVPVVHTLHNYRLICPRADLRRDGHVCEDCLGKLVPYPGILHGCFRSSRTQTGVAAAALTAHRLRGTYRNDIDVYIALSEFARQKCIEGGLPPDKIRVKPNFVGSDLEVGTHAGDYALFVGRLEREKGIQALLRAWTLLNEVIPLKVVGGGELETLLRGSLPEGVEYLGFVPRDEVLVLMQNASFLVFPSEWYEGFPVTIVEAFATGLPIVASRIGSIGEIIIDGYSGWFFVPGDARDLARQVKLAWSDPVDRQRRGANARKEYEDNYSMDKNHQILIDIYQAAIERFQILLS
jgi:glycosyltransferase involved in cell wall biosynthesis